MATLSERPLGWYRVFVHSSTVAGSLVTLVHPPFMAAFLSLVVVGAMGVGYDPTFLLLSLLAVGLLLYAEHMLDDTTMVGKPWETELSDRTLVLAAAVLLVLAGLVGAYASVLLGDILPLLGVVVGAVFSVLYGLEVWEFHRVSFGALGMAAITAFSHLVQARVLGVAAQPALVALVFVLGLTYSYVMLALYEHTKSSAHALAWSLLGLHFITVYVLATIVLLQFA